MPAPRVFDASLLNSQGLNLQSVFNISELPNPLQEQLKELVGDLQNYKQLILIAHGGKEMWNALHEDVWQTEQPIDQATMNTVQHWFTQNYPGKSHRFIYPSNQPINLQALGELAGWHYPSPFLVGINNVWGSWFAYRAVLLSNTEIDLTPKLESQSPCDSCQSKICVELCPAQACAVGSFDMDACLTYRKSENSKCQKTCLARVACPVAKPHKYSKKQMQYHYGISMKVIKELE